MKTIIPLGTIVISVLLSAGCNSVQSRYVTTVNNEFVKQPLSEEKILTESDIQDLPVPVRKYITYSCSVGKNIPQNFRLEFDAQMTKKPGDTPMDATSEQVNFFGNYSRIFFMKASKLLIPFRVLHTYVDEKATMIVRVAGLFNAADISGEQLTDAETVTILNDLCVFSPGSLVDKRLSWKEIDSLSTEVTFTNGTHKVSAIVYFNQQGELINFISNDRSALQDDGSLQKMKWSTPISNYKEIDGRMIGTKGSTIYHYPEGDFTYGTFTLKSIRYNVNQ